MTSYAFRFISGKYQGGEFPLSPNREIIVGRSSDLDMVLVEDMVSRRHAKITVDGEQIILQDLDSTNGTFVNGERIKRYKLSEGDRVLIGTSIMKLVQVEGSEITGNRAQLEDLAAHRRTTQLRTMTGSIDEIPLPDLLQLLSSSKKSGSLVVRTATDAGKLYLNDGQVVTAILNENEDIPQEKAVYRILCWQSGTFYMEPSEHHDVENPLQVPTEGLLMEAMRRLDEMRRIADLPDGQAKLGMPVPLTLPLRDLSPEELDVIQLAHNHGQLDSILNNSPDDDMALCQQVASLVQKGYLQPE